MAAITNYLKRFYALNYPPVPSKSDGAIRFGILGAANIAPQALIFPALSHPEVIVAAIAARDPSKAEAFAKKHGIPIVHQTYDDLIADPTITAIYNPLPNGLHYEWTVKALKAGKHVLLEKPSVSNAEEARSLFRHPILGKPDAPVLLEAFHNLFHPVWQTVLSLVPDPHEIEETEALNYLPGIFFSGDNIRFLYHLAGGCLMDFGAYCVSATCSIYRAEPEAIRSASYRPMPEGLDPLCDEAVHAEYEFPNGGTAKITADLQAKGGYWFPSLTKNWPRFMGPALFPTFRIKLKAKAHGTENGLEKLTQKTIVVHNYMFPQAYHRIDVITRTEFRQMHNGGKLVKSEEKTEYIKAYSWPTKEPGRNGEEWWATYRYQLEEFVNRVKSRKGSGVWVEPEDSIRQMEMIDKTYLKMGLPIRPTSKALEKEGE